MTSQGTRKEGKIGRTSVGVFLASLLLGGIACADDAKKPGKDPSSSEPPAADAGEEEDPEAGTKLKGVELLPIGKTNYSVKLPGYEDGKLTSLVLAGSLTPLDEEELVMEDIEIRMIENEAGKEGVVIEMKTGSYLMPKHLLSSSEETTITRADFTITGESLDFDTRRKFGRMRGRVKAVFKVEAIQPKKEEEATVEAGVEVGTKAEAEVGPIKVEAGAEAKAKVRVDVPND